MHFREKLGENVKQKHKFYFHKKERKKKHTVNKTNIILNIPCPHFIVCQHHERVT